MKRALCLAGALSLALAGCASISRISSYGGGMSDAKFDHAGAAYSADVHPVDPVIMLSPSFGAVVGRSAASSATLGLAGGDRPYAAYKAAAEAFLAPIGCKVAEIYPIDDMFWEARWDCPPGVDPRVLINAQRDRLRQGLPLKP